MDKVDPVDRRAKDTVTVNAKAGAKSEARARHNKANLHKAVVKVVGKVAANLRPAAKVRRSKAVASAINAARARNVVPGADTVLPTRAAIRINLVTQVKVAAIRVAPIKVAAARPSHATVAHRSNDHRRINLARTSPTSKTFPTWTTSKRMPVMTSARKCRARKMAARSPAPEAKVVDKVDKVDKVDQAVPVADVVAVVVVAGAAVPGAVPAAIPMAVKAATAAVRHPHNSLCSIACDPAALHHHTPMLALGFVATFAAAAPLAYSAKLPDGALIAVPFPKNMHRRTAQPLAAVIETPVV